MQRRDLLRNLAFGIPVIGISNTLSGCTSVETPNSKQKSVIVIGAGVAGLAAANALKDSFTVTVLESQDRIGGRLRTDRSLGIPFDEGASWIHGINKNPITELAKKAGMTTAVTDDEDILTYDIGGELYPAAIVEKTDRDFYKVLNELSDFGDPGKSFAQIFSKEYPQYLDNRLWKFFLSAYLAFDCGDLDLLSSRYYDEGLVFSGPEVICTNGYDTIPNFLAKDIQVNLNQRVTGINYTNKKVQVTHNGQTSAADFVLITVPLGVLKADTIEFTPQLPASKRAAISRVGMNVVNKFLLQWESPFWDDSQYLCYTPAEPDKFNYFVNLEKTNPGSNSLLTFAYADAAKRTEDLSDETVIKEIMAHLKDIYGVNTPTPTRMLRTRWATNPNSYGSYSFTGVNTELKDFSQLANPVANQIFFAGEHTHPDYFSTAHGAYLSGLRSAQEILKLQ